MAEPPPRHVDLIRPFAEWHVIREARRRSAHGPYELGPQELAADHAEELFGHCGCRLRLSVGRTGDEGAGLHFGLEVVAEPVEEGAAIDGQAGAGDVSEFRRPGKLGADEAAQRRRAGPRHQAGVVAADVSRAVPGIAGRRRLDVLHMKRVPVETRASPVIRAREVLSYPWARKRSRAARMMRARFSALICA